MLHFKKIYITYFKLCRRLKNLSKSSRMVPVAAVGAVGTLRAVSWVTQQSVCSPSYSQEGSCTKEFICACVRIIQFR